MQPMNAHHSVLAFVSQFKFLLRGWETGQYVSPTNAGFYITLTKFIPQTAMYSHLKMVEVLGVINDEFKSADRRLKQPKRPIYRPMRKR